MRALAERPHPDMILPNTAAGDAVRTVTVNLAESPLGWLYARKRISRAQLEAGARLQRDFQLSGLAPRVTMQWDSASPPPRHARGPAHREDSMPARMDARRRFDAAMAQLGPGLADVSWRVICAGDTVVEAERAFGWPGRSGRVVLTLALDRLVSFYGTSGAG